MAKSTDKIVYLDGIRGVAALCVFFYHFLLTFYSSFASFDPKAVHLANNLEILYGKSIFSVFTSGRFCVNIFFVLSGYVLSRKYFIENNLNIVLSSANRRFLRLYFPVAFTILLSWILMLAGFYYNVPASIITRSDWWLGSFWHFPDVFSKLWHSLLFDTMFLGDSSFDNSMWTMTIELFGSFLIFGFLALTHQIKNRFLMLIFVFLYFMLTDREQYATFIFGISLNYVEKFTKNSNRYFNTILSTALLVAALLLGSFPARFELEGTIFAKMPHPVLMHWEWIPVAGAFFLVMAFVISPRLQRFISLRIFRFLGYISFSFYLLHPIILGSLSCFLFLKLHDQFGYNHTTAIVFVLTLAFSLCVSWLMARYIDAPGMRLSKYVYERWGKQVHK